MDNADDQELFKMWCALFELDPNDDTSHEKFLTVKDELPRIVLSAKEWDWLQEQLAEEPKELPGLRRLLKSTPKTE